MKPQNAWAVPIAVLAFALVARTYLIGPTPIFMFPDSYYYADLGRQLARDRGFSSQLTFPYIVSWMRDAGVSPQPPWPNVARFPLIAVLYAPLFAVFGPSAWTVYLVGAIFHALTAVATFLLGARLFGVGVAIVAALIFAGNVSHVAIAGSGLLELPAAFCLVVATLLFVSLLEGASSRGQAVALGILLGLSFLLRYDLIAITVAAVLVLAVGRGKRGAGQAAWAMLGAAVPPALWMLHNLRAVGSPFVFLGFDRNVLGSAETHDPYAHETYRNVWTVLSEHPEIVTEKLPQLSWPVTHWRILFGWDLYWLGPAFLVAFLVLCARGHRAVRAATFVLVTFAVRVLVLSVTHHEARFYMSYVPVMLVFVVGVAWMPLAAVLRSWDRPRLELGLAVLAGALYVALQPVMLRRTVSSALHETSAASAFPVRIQSEDVYARIRDRTPSDAVFATWRAEAVAWYGDRPSIRLDVQRLRAVEQLGLEIDGLVYSTKTASAVERSLQRQGVAEEYVRVLDNGDLTVWLRRALVSRWLGTG
jgi:4-amino-4-deoxy-L-arabinose transferase-like glycosyltransferase